MTDCHTCETLMFDMHHMHMEVICYVSSASACITFHLTVRRLVMDKHPQLIALHSVFLIDRQIRFILDRSKKWEMRRSEIAQALDITRTDDSCQILSAISALI